MAKIMFLFLICLNLVSLNTNIRQIYKNFICIMWTKKKNNKYKEKIMLYFNISYIFYVVSHLFLQFVYLSLITVPINIPDGSPQE